MEGVPNVDGANTGVISQGFNTQKMNFSKVVQARAASNWQDLQDKYKTEKWQNMPLSERKVGFSFSFSRLLP